MRRTSRELLASAGINLKTYAQGEHRAACPRQDCDGKTKLSLAVKIDEKGATWKCHRCGWKAGASAEHQGEQPKSESPDKREQSIRFALELWDRAKPIKGTRGETCLRNRAIYCPLPEHCLRFDPECWHSDAKRKFPAIIALFTDIRTDAPCGIHRTYLKPDGSGKITDFEAKKMLGRSKGAAVKLAADDEITYGVGIAEGLETALSVISFDWRAMWMLGSADGIAQFPVLSAVDAISIFSDNDANDAGVKAARVCAARWRAAGREATIVYPGTRGHDWNDVAKGIAA